jgi:pyruvate ferredoxin oxidoreductase alpha subunit
MKKILEGSRAIAETINAVKPAVVSAYPITPQTHIVEDLAKLKADGEADFEYVRAESEFAAASIVQGASATGVRVYTATSAQGLLLMTEVIYCIAGMRLPVVMTDSNRAISAPINIWNDQQDSISLRDAGWIQIYAEDNQEAVDFHLIGYRLAEDKRVMLPVMVCMDGFILTHGMETIDLPEQDKVDKFLPKYNPLYKLDPAEPISMGLLADPDYYMETRFAIQETMKSSISYLSEISQEFKTIIGRDYKDLLVEEYQTKDADKVIVAMGSVCGTIKEAIDEQRAKGKKVGLLRIITYRPFPYARVYEALKDVARVAVLDKAVSLGAYAPIAVEMKAAFYGKKKGPKVISSFVGGLGGRDITLESVREILRRLTVKEVNSDFIDLKPELLKEEYGK